MSLPRWPWGPQESGGPFPTPVATQGSPLDKYAEALIQIPPNSTKSTPPPLGFPSSHLIYQLRDC